MEALPAAADRLLGSFEKAMDQGAKDLIHWLEQGAGLLSSAEGGKAGPPVARGIAEGDAVHVWSNSTKRWITDGVVREVLPKDQVVQGGQVLPAGSVRVVFKGGTAMKWVLPPQRQEMLRKASRSGAPQGFGDLPTPQRVVARAAAGPAAQKSARGGGSSVLEDHELNELRSVEFQCKAKGELFVDPEFKPHQLGKVQRWCRPHEVTAQAGRPLGGLAWELFGIEPRGDWQLFRGAPQADDVQQGELGDCWLISSLAALAEFQGGCFVRALLPSQERLNSAGVYLVRLCLGGWWRSILIDDRLPCLEGEKSAFCTQLAFCETHRLQLWASIIEKGLAKACGSYAALTRGQAREALSMLTGWPCEMVCLDRQDFDAGILWATLCSAKEAGFLMTCGTYACQSSLQPYHIYSLMDVLEVTQADGSEVQLLKIRNPHAKCKWQGAWSDTSPLWTPELRQQAGCPEGGVPGVFFMSFSDFLRNFGHCTICKIRSNEWHEVRRAISLPGDDVPSVGLALTASETAECSVILAQPEERLRRGPLYKNYSLPLAGIGFALLDVSPDGGGGPTVVGTAKLHHRAGVSADFWLQAGHSYLLVPLSVHQGAPLGATLACFSSRPLELSEQRPSWEAAEAARAALVPGGIRGAWGGLTAPWRPQAPCRPP